MNRQEKNQLIDELSDLLRAKSVFYLTDASGLDAETTTELRRESVKKNLTVRVVKNTLLRKAMERVEERNFEELYGSLVGQTALMAGDVGNGPARTRSRSSLRNTRSQSSKQHTSKKPVM